MPITSSVRKAGPFAGAGSAGPFTFSFMVFAAADLYVVKMNMATGAETILALTTDYTVSLNADQKNNPGGTITLTSSLAVGYDLTITSSVDALQPTDLTNQGGFYPSVITTALDRAAIVAQQLKEKSTRSLAFPVSDSTTSATLPAVAQRATNVLAFDAAGAPIAGPSIASVGTVSGNIANINTVAADVANINIVAGDKTRIDAVAGDLANIDAVAGDQANIDAVAADRANIDVVAGAVVNVNNFAGVYYGPAAVDPATRKDGSALQNGDLYYNTVATQMRVYDGGTHAWLSSGGAFTLASGAEVAAGTDTLKALTPANAQYLKGRPALTDLLYPSVNGGLRDIHRGGWNLPLNQQWGGHLMPLPDGSFGDTATGSVAWDTLFSFGDANATYQATHSFKVSKAGSLNSVVLRMSKAGNPTDNMQIFVYSDNAGLPNALITNGTATVQAGTLHTSNANGDLYRFFFPTPPSLAANTKYYIVARRSGAADGSNYWRWHYKSASAYPHGNFGSGTNVPAWTAYTSSAAFMVELTAASQFLQMAGRFDAKIQFNQGNPINQSDYLTRPLREFLDGKSFSYAGLWTALTKDKTFLDFAYGLNHDRILCRCNVATGYVSLYLYDSLGALHTITGTTDVSSGLHQVGIKCRMMNDGADYLYLYVDGVSQGAPITGHSFPMDPNFRELGTATIGGGFGLAPTMTATADMSVLPSAATPLWGYAGTATEAAHAVVNGGRLYVQIAGVNDLCYWERANGATNANGWSALAKMRTPKNADVAGANLNCFLAATDGSKTSGMLMRSYFVETYQLSANQKVQIDMTKDHVFLMTGKGSDFYLYCDGALVIDGTGLMTTASGTNVINFGDADVNNNGESVWDYVSLYNTAAILPEYTSGILHEHAIWSGDMTALLPLLWNAGTPISAKSYCGVGGNYVNRVFRSHLRRGITGSPTTTATTTAPAVIPEMEGYAFGESFELDYNSAAKGQAGSDGEAAYFDLAIDAATGTNPTLFYEPIANYYFATPLKDKLTLPFGLHKYTAHWGITGHTLQDYGGSRRLSVKEAM